MQAARALSPTSNKAPSATSEEFDAALERVRQRQPRELILALDDVRRPFTPQHTHSHPLYPCCPLQPRASSARHAPNPRLRRSARCCGCCRRATRPGIAAFGCSSVTFLISDSPPPPLPPFTLLPQRLQPWMRGCPPLRGASHSPPSPLSPCSSPRSMPPILLPSSPLPPCSCLPPASSPLPPALVSPLRSRFAAGRHAEQRVHRAAAHRARMQWPRRWRRFAAADRRLGARRHAAPHGTYRLSPNCSTRHRAAPMTRMLQASSALPLPPSAIAADISIRAKAEARGPSPFSPILSPSLFCRLCLFHNLSASPTP